MIEKNKKNNLEVSNVGQVSRSNHKKDLLALFEVTKVQYIVDSSTLGLTISVCMSMGLNANMRQCCI